MSGRRAINRIRGPQSALTDFLAANNISAAQIRDDFERRRRLAAESENAGEGPANLAGTEAETPVAADEAGADADAEVGVTGEARSEPMDLSETERNAKRRKSSAKSAAEKIKKQKEAAKKGKKGAKKRGSDDDDYGDDDLGAYKKSRPAPGQFEHCEKCSKRFTVTPYSKEGPEGGLLCTPCGKQFAKGVKKEERALAKKPVGRKRRKMESDRLDGVAAVGAKSLKQLCVEKIVKHHEEIDELGDVPPSVLERLSEIFSKKRVMRSTTLPLFLRPDLRDVVVHDAAYLETEDYSRIFATVPKVRRLVLGNACQMKDETVEYMLERCSELRYLQLYAANLISDKMWLRLVREMGERLAVLKLKWLDAAFDDSVVQEMVRHCPNLDRIKLKACRRVGEESVNSISELPRLRHLSLQLSHQVSTESLIKLVDKRGADLQTLSLEKFVDADDSLLKAVHDKCSRLTKLRFSENDTATDAGFEALFTDWRNPPLTYVDFNSTRDVDASNPDGPDAAVGLASAGFRALMAHSGTAIKHLDVSSCRHIRLSAFMDVFNGAVSYPALEYINVSFCNKVDTAVVAGIFKSCPALKQLVAFGCFDVRDVVVPRAIALIGVPRASDALEQFGVGIEVDEAIGRMVGVTA